MRVKRLVIGMVLTLALSACGSGGSGGSTVLQTGASSVTSTSTGTTTTEASVQLVGAVVSVPTGTTLTAADGTPVTGAISVNVSYGTSSTPLPANELVIPQNTALKGYLDIVIGNGTKTVKNVNPAIPVAMSVSAPNGTVVDIYSHSGAVGASWVKEGTATVQGGVVTFNISHFSTYACFQSTLTGLTGGSNGGVTQQ